MKKEEQNKTILQRKVEQIITKHQNKNKQPKEQEDWILELDKFEDMEGDC